VVRDRRKVRMFSCHVVRAIRKVNMDMVTRNPVLRANRQVRMPSSHVVRDIRQVRMYYCHMIKDR
jgi:hypothetical protein